MKSSHITQDTIAQWRTHSEEHLQQWQERALYLYGVKRGQMKEEDIPRLDQAIEQRYLVMPKSKSGRIIYLRWAYEHWCMAKGIPTLFVLPTSREHIVRIELDLDTMEPHGNWNLYRPELDLEDERFRLMMLLCHEYMYTSAHVTLRQVNKDHADEVASELLALFDRSYQAHLAVVETFLKGHTQT